MSRGIDTDDRARDVAALSRRAILGGAAAGFAQAANGLFLPEWLQETDAREGDPGDAKGGRHGKDHKGRHRKRRHGDKKDKGKPHRSPGAGAPGGSLIRYVAFRVVAGDLAPAAIRVDFYFRVKRGLDEFGPLVFAQSAEGLVHGNTDYAPNRYSIAAYIRGDALPDPIFIEFTNVLFHNGVALAPYGSISKGGAVDSNGVFAGGTTLYAGDFLSDRPINSNLGKGCCGRDMKLRVGRLDDSDTHKWLSPSITWR